MNAGYGYGYASTSSTHASGGIYVGEPSPYYVNSMPPQPLYESMTPSPGYGYVWIDGYWHWSGYEWEWMPGRWVQQQSGYYYVQPYYDYGYDGRYVYTPGYWTRPDRLPPRGQVRDHRDGRPPVVVRPPPVINQPGTRPPPVVNPPGHGQPTR
ncbi:MAG: hypothetical protein K8M05_14505, partial [Deltaproteobacteria bacterium]|nr:hypothetical protein [Kofleriaceae bacterium]